MRKRRENGREKGIERKRERDRTFVAIVLNCPKRERMRDPVTDRAESVRKAGNKNSETKQEIDLIKTHFSIFYKSD